MNATCECEQIALNSEIEGTCNKCVFPWNEEESSKISLAGLSTQSIRVNSPV